MNMRNARQFINFHASILFRPEYLHYTACSLHTTSNFNPIDKLAKNSEFIQR